MAHENTIYVIVPFVEVTQEMIDACAETSFDTLRHSVQGVDRVVLKWIGAMPAVMSGYTQYSYNEILIEMAKDEWNYTESSSSSEG